MEGQLKSNKYIRALKLEGRGSHKKDMYLGTKLSGRTVKSNKYIGALNLWGDGQYKKQMY